jgi:serine/threonine-protein kinase
VAPIELSAIKPGLRIGRLSVVELYPEGRGGMARVVRARQRDTRGAEVALKISRVGSHQTYYFSAIHKEVEVLQRLDHAGVVRLAAVSDGKIRFKERAVEITGSPWFFGMECLHGGSLEKYIRTVGPLTLGETAAIAHQVGMALVHVHSCGFAHNDVKPDNIIFRRPLKVGEKLEPVLIDFGVAAKLVRQQLDGSVVYMAPERLQELRDPGPPEAAPDPAKADVWSMGILLYRMLVGREPFVGVTDRSITSAILRSTPAPMGKSRQDVPAAIDEFVTEGCLAKDPSHRVGMAEFVQFIERYSADWRTKRVESSKRRVREKS